MLHSRGRAYASQAFLSYGVILPTAALEVGRVGAPGPVLHNRPDSHRWAHIPGPASQRLDRALPMAPCDPIATGSQPRPSGLSCAGLKIDVGWVTYGCCENPARGGDGGCPENVLQGMKQNPEPSWEFHGCLGFRSCLFLFLGSDLSFLSLSLLASLLLSLPFFSQQPQPHTAHTHVFCLMPPSKNPSRSNKLSLRQVA